MSTACKRRSDRPRRPHGAGWPALLAGWLGLLGAGGCGGNYILTVPDQLASPGEAATVVVRLQRNDFFVLAPAIKRAAMRMRIADGPERDAFTDDLGYAAAAVLVPDKPGTYPLTVLHMDSWGDEIGAKASVHVWQADRPVVAVDLDCLPGLLIGGSQLAPRALQHVLAGASVLYLTRSGASRHGRLRQGLARAGYPAGPILSWQRQYWHVVRDGRYYNMPRIVVENRLVSQLPDLRKMFPNMTTGVCDSALAAEAFAGAGMRVVFVGAWAPKVKTELVRRNTWADLDARGL